MMGGIVTAVTMAVPEVVEPFEVELLVGHLPHLVGSIVDPELSVSSP